MTPTFLVPPATATILVIENNADIQTAVVQTLQKAGYTVIRGTTAASAPVLARAHRPDLILLEAVLPDGPEAVEQIRSAPDLAGVFVVLLSGVQPDPAERADDWPGQADGSIVYPVSPTILLGWVDTFLRLRLTQEKAEHYSQLFQAESDTILLVNNQTGQILEANAAAVALYGYSMEELLARTVTDLSAEPEKTRRLINTPTNRIVTVPLRLHRKKDGTTFPVEITGSFFTRRGRPVLLVAIRDITVRRQTEKALQERESRAEAMLKAIPDLMFRMNRQGVILDYKADVDDLCISPEVTIIGQPHRDVVPPELADLIDRKIYAALEQGTLQAFEYQLSLANQGERGYEARMIVSGVDEVTVIVRDITDRRRAEEALRESESRYRSLFENNHAIMLIIDPRGGAIMDVNPAAARYYGWPSDQLRQKNIGEINILSQAEIQSEMDCARREQRNYFLFQHRLADGSIRDVEVFSGPIIIQARPLLYSIVHDITDRKQAERALQQNEKRFRALVEKSSDALTLLSAQGIIIYEGPMVERITGYAVGERAGKGGLESVYPEDMPVVEAAYSRILACSGSSENIQIRSVKKDGSIWWTEATITNLLDEPSVQAIVVNYRDITARKQAEDALRESEQNFSTLAENAYDGILIAIAGDAYCYANRRAAEITGYSVAELLTITMPRLVHPDELPRLGDQLYGKSSKADRPDHYETRIVTPTGLIKPVEVTVSYTVWHGQPADLFSLRDITDRKLAEATQAALATQNRQIEKIESLSRMAGAIAHHFNNQLQSVVGYLELAMMKNLSQPEQQSKFVLQAATSAHRAAEMSRLMLTYLGLTPDAHRPLHLTELCACNLPSLRAMMPPNVTIQTDLPVPGPVVNAGENQFKQILTNLLTNAWEAIGDRQGVIHLSVKEVSLADIPPTYRFPPDWQPQTASYACLRVADTGCGIESGDIEKIFDPFFTKKFIGRGMGLAVVLGIVRAHSGVVTVESKPGHGSTFRVFFELMANPL